MTGKILNLFPDKKNRILKEKTQKQIKLQLKETKGKIILFYDFLQRQFEVNYLDESDYSFFCEKKKIIKRYGNYLFTKEDEKFLNSLIYEEVEGIINGLLSLLEKEEVEDFDIFYGCLLLRSKSILSCSQCFWGHQKGICGEKLKTVKTVLRIEDFSFSEFITSENILDKIEELFL